MLRGLYPEPELQELELELEHQQRRLLAGELPVECGTVILDDPDAVIDGVPFAHYVCHVTEVSEIARVATYHPALVAVMRRLLGEQAWLLEDDRFGVVYQDARPGGRSGYSRIGWHSDHQSGPHLEMWPSVGVTIHIDATSPRNGFLRVLPGSHLGGTDEMPLGFEHVPGEIALYCERGDVLLHHSDLWHSAQLAPPTTVRARSAATCAAAGTAAPGSRRTTASTTSSRTRAADQLRQPVKRGVITRGAGVTSCTSNAPTSTLLPTTRAKPAPRWSNSLPGNDGTGSGPVSTAGLPAFSAIVCVAPPLFASGSSPGSVTPSWLPPPSVSGIEATAPMTDAVVVTLLASGLPPMSDVPSSLPATIDPVTTPMP